jgi:hypothetical protein
MYDRVTNGRLRPFNSAGHSALPNEKGTTNEKAKSPGKIRTRGTPRNTAIVLIGAGQLTLCRGSLWTKLRNHGSDERSVTRAVSDYSIDLGAILGYDLCCNTRSDDAIKDARASAFAYRPVEWLSVLSFHNCDSDDVCE